MDLIPVLPNLHCLRFTVGQAYLWQDADGLTLVDSGIPGSAPDIAAAIGRLGHRTADLRRLVLTHYHVDHVGGAAEIVGWGDVTVYAHAVDAPVIRGTATGPSPQLADWERELFAGIREQLGDAVASPVRVDHELDDGDVVDFGGGARVLWTPGHTPGSMALYLAEHRVLFTGDTIARGPEGDVMLGVFNADPAQTAESFRRLSTVDAEVACFGHGGPLTRDAASQIRPVAAKLA